MGYYTTYNLEMKGVSQSDINTYIMPFLRSRGIINYALEDACEPYYGEYYIIYSCQPAKWYEYELDITDLSSLVPWATFKLNGSGEDFNDNWNMYFHDGKVEECYAVIPPPKKIAW